MTDIVKKLRNGEPADSQYSNDLMREAADEIERLRKESAIHSSNTLAAIDDCNDALDEIERLRADVEKLLKTCRGYEGANGKLRAEIAKLREALDSQMADRCRLNVENAKLREMLEGRTSSEHDRGLGACETIHPRRPTEG